MLKRCSSREISEWIAYDRLEPFGELRGDLRSAIIAAVVASANSKKSFKPKDFMPFMDEQEKKPFDWEKARDALKALAQG